MEKDRVVKLTVTIAPVSNVLGNSSIKPWYIYRLAIPVLLNSLSLLQQRVLAQAFFYMIDYMYRVCLKELLLMCVWGGGGFLCIGTIEVYLHAELLTLNSRISHQDWDKLMWWKPRASPGALASTLIPLPDKNAHPLVCALESKMSRNVFYIKAWQKREILNLDQYIAHTVQY